MKAALKPFLVLLVVAGLGLGITIYGGHKLGAAAVEKLHDGLLMKPHQLQSVLP